jgi:ParB family chromosome partitioning protein
MGESNAARAQTVSDNRPQPGQLTRGLAALFQRTSPAQIPGTRQKHQFMEVPVARVQANAYQPRREFDADGIAQLAESLKSNGVLQPIVVMRSGTGFELISGERRLRASKAAGLETIPALVREVSEDERLELALVENIQRTNLNALELARAYAMMVKKFGLSHEEVAKRLSVSRPAVVNTLRLLDLPESVKELVASGKMSAGHARAILSLPSEKSRLALATEVMERGLSVRDTEARAGQSEPRIVGNEGPRREQAARPAHLRPLETRLAEKLGTKVRIIEGRRKGKILIEFYSNDDFERILEIMGAAA